MGAIPIQFIDNDREMRPVFEELDRLMDEVAFRAYQAFEARGHADGHALDDWLEAESQVLGVPAGDLRENGDAYELRVGLAGFVAAEIQVLATQQDLVVRAETAPDRRGARGKVNLKVMRRFLLPPGAMVTEARLARGVLIVQMPKQ